MISGALSLLFGHLNILCWYLLLQERRTIVLVLLLSLELLEQYIEVHNFIVCQVFQILVVFDLLESLISIVWGDEDRWKIGHMNFHDAPSQVTVCNWIFLKLSIEHETSRDSEEEVGQNEGIIDSIPLLHVFPLFISEQLIFVAKNYVICTHSTLRFE